MSDIDDGSDKPLGYVTEDGVLEVRESVDRDGTVFCGYHETELGQHDRWMRQAPELFEKYMALLDERDSLYDVCNEFVRYWTTDRGNGDAGCSMCGGLPHSGTCFVGRIAALVEEPQKDLSDTRIARDESAAQKDNSLKSSAPSIEEARQALEVCRACGGAGEHEVGHRVTRDMASDAGEPEMEGMAVSERERCEECYGAGYIPDERVDALIAAVTADVERECNHVLKGWQEATRQLQAQIASTEQQRCANFDAISARNDELEAQIAAVTLQAQQELQSRSDQPQLRAGESDLRGDHPANSHDEAQRSWSIELRYDFYWGIIYLTPLTIWVHNLLIGG